jgi:protein SCO1/2
MLPTRGPRDPARLSSGAARPRRKYTDHVGPVDVEERSSDAAGEDRRPPRGRAGTPLRRMVLPLGAVLVGALALGVVLSTTSHTALPATRHSVSFEGNELSPPKPAPPLSLRNYTGERVNIDQYRGKAVLVTFLYTHCPDVCPLIAANLRVAQSLMGSAAAKAQIIAVSVDPHGDTPQTVAAFLKQHGMTGRMKYLIGTTRELGAVWKAWGVGSEVDAQQPDLVNHSALVYGIDAQGVERTVYISDDWKPSEIAHDAPLLAAQ